MSKRRANELALVSAGAAAAFASIAWASATRKSAHVDRLIAPRIALRPRSRARPFAERLSPIGKWYSIVPAAIVTGAVVARSTRRIGPGVTIVAASVASTLLSVAFDQILPQPPVPQNHRHEPRKAVFPSGHAMIATASSLTAAYVAGREGVASASATMPAAISFSLANPALKLAVRKHWPTDAVGGLAAGLAVAAGCCALYEMFRD